MASQSQIITNIINNNLNIIPFNSYDSEGDSDDDINYYLAMGGISKSGHIVVGSSKLISLNSNSNDYSSNTNLGIQMIMDIIGTVQ